MNGKLGTNAGERAVAYGFKKQLEETDILLLNKIDLFSTEEITEITDHIRTVFPGVPVIKISGLQGRNIDKLEIMTGAP